MLQNDDSPTNRTAILNANLQLQIVNMAPKTEHKIMTEQEHIVDDKYKEEVVHKYEWICCRVSVLYWILRKQNTNRILTEYPVLNI